MQHAANSTQRPTTRHIASCNREQTGHEGTQGNKKEGQSPRHTDHKRTQGSVKEGQISRYTGQK
ncbi:hypothetical protein E2C01_086805 [Portunus trituberculatus]|uniref:Uncharacterized protein n=1 Tax=Portunus trituberculatus TaxID=210409 RepID=A0A5B7JFM4_PORTR|nr:hypothetical protein [Portunus trituberculatus]